MVSSGPATPLVSCQPNGEAMASYGSEIVVRPSVGGTLGEWIGLSYGAGYTL